MLSANPVDASKLSGNDLEKQLLRIGLNTALEAINLYERLSAQSEDDKVKKALQGIIKREKEHVGELETLLLRHDVEQMEELAEGTKEIEKYDEHDA